MPLPEVWAHKRIVGLGERGVGDSEPSRLQAGESVDRSFRLGEVVAPLFGGNLIHTHDNPDMIFRGIPVVRGPRRFPLPLHSEFIPVVNQGEREHGKRSEHPINPEKLLGREYRVPTMYRNGDAYFVDNVSLPKDWKTLAPNLAHYDKAGLQYGLDLYCEGTGITHDLEMDSVTGLVTRVHFASETGKSSFALRTEGPHMGTYETENGGTRSLLSTFIFMQFMSRYFWTALGDKRPHAYPRYEGLNKGFSHELSIPQELIESNQPLMTGEEMKKFRGIAHTLACQFDQSNGDLLFDEKRGLLTEIPLKMIGGMGGYVLRGREYQPEHVVSLENTAALHTIAAAYINILLDRAYPQVRLGITQKRS